MVREKRKAITPIIGEAKPKSKGTQNIQSVTLRLDKDLVLRAKSTWYEIPSFVREYSFSSFIEEAVRQYVQKMENEYNDGKHFTLIATTSITGGRKPKMQ